MKYAALLTLLSFALSCPVMAKSHHLHHIHHLHHHHDAAERTSHHPEHSTAHDTAHASHSGITCEMVRAYVAKVGLGQAIAMAKSAGITAVDEQKARQCLAKRI